MPQDHQAEGGGEISPELDPMGANDDPDGDGVKDQYVNDPYNPTHFEIIDEEDETPETQDKSVSFNMLSFIRDSEDNYVLKLATVRDNMGVSNLASQVTDSSGSKILNKIVKHSPPILDAKLRLSHEAGKYPADRSADLCHTLTAEVNIGGVDAFILFNSGAETDALSPDFIRACHIPLLKLLNPLVLQMGTKGSHSCVYYGTNVDIIIHGVKDSHYFDIVNIDCYNMVLGAPWLNIHGVILDFTNHTIQTMNGDIKTFDVLTEHSFRLVGSRACYGVNPQARKSLQPKVARKSKM